MSQQKPDLSSLLAETAGSTRKKPPIRVVPEPSTAKAKAGTSPITVHFPKEVRNQLKILAVETNKTMQNLIAEAYNDLFAKYKKPEIAPIERRPEE